MEEQVTRGTLGISDSVQDSDGENALLVYGKTGHLPVELEFESHWTIKRWNMNLQSAGIKRQIQLAELDEWREKAYHSSKLYKERTKRWHDK